MLPDSGGIARGVDSCGEPEGSSAPNHGRSAWVGNIEQRSAGVGESGRAGNEHGRRVRLRWSALRVHRARQGLIGAVRLEFLERIFRVGYRDIRHGVSNTGAEPGKVNEVHATLVQIGGRGKHRSHEMMERQIRDAVRRAFDWIFRQLDLEVQDDGVRPCWQGLPEFASRSILGSFAGNADGGPAHRIREGTVASAGPSREIGVGALPVVLLDQPLFSGFGNLRRRHAGDVGGALPGLRHGVDHGRAIQMARRGLRPETVGRPARRTFYVDLLHPGIDQLADHPVEAMAAQVQIVQVARGPLPDPPGWNRRGPGIRIRMVAGRRVP